MPDSSSTLHEIKISELPVAPAANPTDQLEANQAGVSRSITLDQVATVIAGSVQITSGRPLTPQMFGARGDGTDQTAALQTWLNKLRDGYSLYAPPGDYRTSVKLVCMPYTAAAPPNATTQTPRPSIVFDNNAIFKATAAMTSIIEFGATAGDFSGCFFDSSVRGGTFDGNFLANSCVDVIFARNFSFDSCYFKNALAQYVKGGDAGSPALSFQILVKNCRTVRDIITAPISAITKANPGVVTTSAAHGFVNGDTVCIISAAGMVEVNNLYFTVAGATPTTFQLSGVDTTGYGTYTGSGTVAKTVMGSGLAGIRWLNVTDNHAINNQITGVEIGLVGLTSGAGLFDAKITNNHVWNYLQSGRVLYGYDVGGDCSLVGNQVDGPFSYGYRFTGPRNSLVASNTNYTPLTYGGRDNTDYALKIETGGGVSCFGCTFKAQSASARLAGVATGDVTNCISLSQTALNVAGTTNISRSRRDVDASVIENLDNRHVGANANVQYQISTNAGTYTQLVKSTAGGGTYADDWSGAGDRFYYAGSAGAKHRFQFNYVDKLTIDTNGAAIVGAMTSTTAAVSGALTAVSGTFSGAITTTTADFTNLRIAGASKGIRFVPSATQYAIEATDQTWAGSFQPLFLNGSAVTIGPPLTLNAAVTALATTAIAAGSAAQAFIKASSTANLGIYYGTGVPGFSAAKGSLYSCTNATTTTTRLYVNTDGAATWATVTTSA